MFAMLTGKLPYTAEPFHITTLYNKMKKNDMNPIPEHLSACKFNFNILNAFNLKIATQITDTGKHAFKVRKSVNLKDMPCSQVV